MLKAAVGHSADIDLDVAVAGVVSQVKREFAVANPSAGILHIADNLDHAYVVSEVRKAFPGMKLVGCSSAGEASTVLGFREDSVLLVAFASPDVSFAVGIGRNPSQDAARAADEAYAQVKKELEGQEARLCFMFSDAVTALPDVALRTLTELTGGEVAIIGGAAASYPLGDTTYLYFDDEILTDALVLLALGGPLQLSVSSETSWNPVGKPGRITKADGNRIYQIDGAPAPEFYYQRLGKDAEVFLGAPLGILEPDGGITVRAPISVDHDSRTIHVAGGVQEGDAVQVLYASVDEVRYGASAVMDRTMADFPENNPALVFFCSCAARKMYLALDVSSEIEQIKGKIKADVPVAGFYSYGEIGSRSLSNPASFHNQAIVTVAVR